MTRYRFVAAVLLVLGGWLAARLTASPHVADFEMTIDAPGGRSLIHCTRGCDFTHDVGSLDGKPSPNTDLTWGCSGARCSITINGSGHVMK